MVLYDRARVGPTTKTSDEISIICLFRLILQANPLFLFGVVVFELLRSQMLIPYLFPRRCSHTPMWILILHDNRDCHVNPFSTGVFLFKWIRSFQHQQDLFLALLNGVVFIRSKLTYPPTLFLQGHRFLNRVSILMMGSLSILFRQCSYPVILRKILTEP